MATYTELRNLFNHDGLRNRLEVAIVVAAEAIRNEEPTTDNHANRLLWAQSAFSNVTTQRDKMLMALLAANRELTVEQLTGAADTALQTAVNDVINLFATG